MDQCSDRERRVCLWIYQTKIAVMMFDRRDEKGRKRCRIGTCLYAEEVSQHASATIRDIAVSIPHHTTPSPTTQSHKRTMYSFTVQAVLTSPPHTSNYGLSVFHLCLTFNAKSWLSRSQISVLWVRMDRLFFDFIKRLNEKIFPQTCPPSLQLWCIFQYSNERK